MEGTNLMADILDPEERAAEFARTFRNTTDLDQRRRFAQDISESKLRDDERRAQAFEELQLRNPDVMRAVTGRMAEERQQRTANFNRSIAEKKLDWDQEKAYLANKIAEDKLDLQIFQEKRMAAKAEREIQDAKRIEFDTDAFERGESELRDMGVLPGTQAYRDGMVRLVGKHPYIDREVRDVFLQGIGITDPDDLQAQIAELQERFPDRKVSLSATGKPIVGAESTMAPDSKIDLSRLDRLKAKVAEQRAKKPEQQNAELIGYLDNEIAEIDKQRVAAKGGTSETQVAQPTVKPPSDFEAAAAAVLPGQTFTFGGKTWRKPVQK
jgi:hypothetical protein